MQFIWKPTGEILTYKMSTIGFHECMPAQTRLTTNQLINLRSADLSILLIWVSQFLRFRGCFHFDCI